MGTVSRTNLAELRFALAKSQVALTSIYTAHEPARDAWAARPDALLVYTREAIICWQKEVCRKLRLRAIPESRRLYTQRTQVDIRLPPVMNLVVDQVEQKPVDGAFV